MLPQLTFPRAADLSRLRLLHFEKNRFTFLPRLMVEVIMQLLRRVFQIAILLAALVTGYRYANGWTRISIETFCPFGGLEGMLSLVTNRQFTCATGERNLVLFIALVGLTLLTRRVFCSWICPVGTLSEWILKLVRRTGPGRRSHGNPSGTFISGTWDNRLRWLRVPVLLTILYLTWQTGELIFRSVDPYYVLFSFHGHDVMWWSYGVIGLILAGIVLVPMAWCRYLCPLGGALWPLSRVGLLRLRRSESCTGCRKCDAVCPQGIAVSSLKEVLSGECTLCLDCRNACPVHGVLELHLPGGLAS